jgi:type IV pilus assembly protein PilQ
MVRALVLAAILAPTAAHADYDLCARDAPHHGAPIDLDVAAADLHDVFRLLADVGHVNLVVSDDVAGKVTLRLKRVAWDLAACTVAKVHHLRVTVDGNILLVRRADR